MRVEDAFVGQHVRVVDTESMPWNNGREGTVEEIEYRHGELHPHRLRVALPNKLFFTAPPARFDPVLEPAWE